MRYNNHWRIQLANLKINIFSPQRLWKDYVSDRDFNFSAAYMRKTPNHIERAFYIDGEVFADHTRVRIFCRLFTPVDLPEFELNPVKTPSSALNDTSELNDENDFSINLNSSPKDCEPLKWLGSYEKLIIYMGEQSQDELPLLLESGCAILVPDYIGKSNANRYTIYPAALSYCNLSDYDNTEDDIYKTASYIWAAIAMRSVTLAKCISEKVLMFGVGLGGSAAFKTLASNSLDGGIFLNNILPEYEQHIDDSLSIRAALDNTAYASITKCPVQIIVSSNEPDGSINAMNELACAISTLKSYIIIPRGSHNNMSRKYAADINLFIYNCFNNTFKRTLPRITARNSDGLLYYEIKCDESVSKVTLFAATALSKPQYRNWTPIKLTSSGDNEWFAKCSVYDLDIPVGAYVHSKYVDGEHLSSPIIFTSPAALKITPAKKVPHRLIYDSDMGMDTWCADGVEPLIAEGPLKIEGITSETNELVTYKLGDIVYRAEDDFIIQMIIAGEKQTLKIETVDDDDVVYTAFITLSGKKEWSKFTLSHDVFKSASKTLDSWKNIVKLKISGTDAFLINSMLWV